MCGATPLGSFDMIGFGLGREVCALCVPDPPLRSVVLGGADNLKFLARRKWKYQSLLIQTQGCRRVLIQHTQREGSALGLGAQLHSQSRGGCCDSTEARPCPSSCLPALVKVQVSLPLGSAVSLCPWRCAQEGISLPRPPWEEQLLRACSWVHSCRADGALGARLLPVLDLSWVRAMLLFQQGGDRQLGGGVGMGRKLRGSRSPLNGKAWTA